MKKIAVVLVVGIIGMAQMVWAADGAALYKSKMCGAACHGAGKKGGDLKDSKMDKVTLVKFMKDPKSVNPKATMGAVKGTDEELGAIADYMLTLRK